MHVDKQCPRARLVPTSFHFCECRFEGNGAHSSMYIRALQQFKHPGKSVGVFKSLPEKRQVSRVIQLSPSVIWTVHKQKKME